MINDFLSDILKIVIVLDLLGSIAYFLLGLRTKAQPAAARVPAVEAEPSGNESADLFGPGFLNPADAASEPPAAVYGAPERGFWKRLRSRLSRKSRALHRVPAESLDRAMSRLRGVLNSYERGLSI